MAMAKGQGERPEEPKERTSSKFKMQGPPALTSTPPRRRGCAWNLGGKRTLMNQVGIRSALAANQQTQQQHQQLKQQQ